MRDMKFFNLGISCKCCVEGTGDCEVVVVVNSLCGPVPLKANQSKSIIIIIIWILFSLTILWHLTVFKANIKNLIF